MTYKNRYILRIFIFLTALLAAGSALAQGVHVYGNVYGGGRLADVKTNTVVNMSAGLVSGNVYGGGKGSKENYLCDSAMVGVIDDGITFSVVDGKATYTLLDGGTTVTISGGTVGTLDGEGKLIENTGNIYGGGEIGRVERNTQVTIGSGDNDGAGTQGGTPAPVIMGSVFGAGAGVATHGYSALVRGNSTVTIQGNAKVLENVYGGGEMATAGRYWVKGFSAPNEGETLPPAPDELSIGMPYKTRCGGICSVTVRGYAQIGPDAGASEYVGHVFGAGKGVASDFQPTGSDKSQKMTPDGLADFENENGKTPRENYFEFLQTLALATETHVTIGGNTIVKGSVYGGSQSGFVQDDTDVQILGGSIGDNVFGGGKGLTLFSNAGIVKGNTGVTINGGTTNGSVYGGGELGNVKETTEVNIYAKKENNKYVAVAKGSEEVTIAGNVFGGGKGQEDTFTCEKAMVGIDGDGIEHPGDGTTVRIGNGTIGNGTSGGNVYGGGEVGRVEKNTVVIIGFGEGGDNTSKPYIKGNVFGAGAGKSTHGFSALVRGNSTVTVEGDAQIGKSVYGGGQIASVGRYVVINSLPTKPAGGGLCTVNIQGHAIIGQDSEGDVFGAGKGVMPYEGVTGTPWSMKRDDHGVDYEYSYNNTNEYFTFIQTLALANDTEVTIGDDAKVKGSVYGGSESGFVQRYTSVTIQDRCEVGTTSGSTDVDGDIYGGGRGADTVEGYEHAGKVKGNTTVNVDGGTIHGSVYGGGEKGYTIGCANVNMAGGTVNHDVYGGGALADTNKGNGDDDNGYVEVSGLTTGSSSVDGYYENTYVPTTNQTAVANKTYYTQSGSDYVAVIVLAVGTSLEDLETELYEKSGSTYTVTTDNTAVADKIYYSQSGVVLIITAGTNIGEANLYEWSESDYVASSGTAVAGKKYYTITHPTTVNLLGGTIKGDAYGGGLGQLGDAVTGVHYTAEDPEVIAGTKSTDDWKVEPVSAADGNGSVKALVYGEVNVNLGSSGSSSATAFYTTYDNDNNGAEVVKSGRVFGCNNLNGSPQEDVTVTVWRTVAGNGGAKVRTTAEAKASNKVIMDNNPDNYESVSGFVTPTYEVAAVYGGGNLAPYTAEGKKAHVIIYGCDDTSIQTVYGGGNAAAVPETDVDIYSCYEIGSVFGGGNGKDKYKIGNSWETNPGANVNGNANTLIYGGTVHEAYGGSNEKGTITGSVTIDIANSGLESTDPMYCPLDVAKLVGAGKNADVGGDMKLIMGCKPETKIPLVYGGADNANVNGNVELTVTSGNFGKVVGGNNNGGRIKGHIILNIEETTCIPINIDHLYLCGYNAAYSQYGYYVKTTETEAGTGYGDSGEHAILTSAGKLDLIPRESADDPHLPVNTYSYSESGVASWTVFQITGNNKFEGYDPPVLNVISCTSIGEVFGGGYGAGAIVYGNPTVNINMIPGLHADEIDRDGDGHADGDADALGAIGDVYGGGDAAAVYGNTTVNIGTATKVDVYDFVYDNVNKKYELQYETDGVTPKMIRNQDVAGVYITGDVYGGGKLANVGDYHEVVSGTTTTDVVDVEGSTFVNIGIKKTEILGENDVPTGTYNYTGMTFAAGAPGIIIGGNVYGGGKGEAKESGDGAFRCGKAMVTKNTNVTIYNGTIGDGDADHGHVYGGGEKGRVQENTTVTIGCEDDANSAPVITGNVFGAGKGVNTHGYSALTRGNSYVTVQGSAKVKKSVYGGGEIASVGKYNINAQGLPESLANQNSGYCTVIVRDNAVIGPDAAMVMTATGYPDDMGHVFGAGKGVLPYEGYADNKKAWRVTPGNAKQEYLSKNEAIAGTNESTYLPYVETLGLATQTYVTIDENAFVKGSVYGGSENGYVQHDTQVNIQGNCQIGNGYVQMNDNGTYLATMFGVNRRYTAKEWEEGHLFVNGDPEIALTTPTDPNETPTIADATETALRTAVGNNYTTSLPECASWPYGQKTGDDKYAPWDKYYGTANYDSKGGRTTADDGHTFYGNVFGGGSGVIPYRPGKWHPEAGSVGGDTEVNITGGHILTNVYGGNELTDVYGKCTVNFGGTATLGVPRTLKQIAAHPLTCYLFGAGKGDQRVLFNMKTNVREVEINITGGWIYGSVFGGGEDGHVHRNVTMTISEADYAEDNTKTRTKIGTWGTSYVDGNVFGGGRGFGADAYTAGNVAGTVTMNILGGTMLGSIYGGGRLGSVGYGLFDAETNGTTTPGYGEMRPDNTGEDSNPTPANNFKRGYVYMTIGNDDGTGPTIGNTHEYIIPSASSGPMSDDSTPVPTLPADIKDWDEDDWTAWREYNYVPKTEYEYNESEDYYMLKHTKGGNVFAGGMGNFYKQDGKTYINGVDWWKLGCVKSTTLIIKGGTIMSNVYGGGELGQVVGHHEVKDSEGHIVYTDANNTNAKVTGTEIIIQGNSTTIGTGVEDGNTVKYTFGSVFGGGYGSLLEKITVNNKTSYPKYIAGLVEEDTKIDMQNGAVKASIYGGGEMASINGSTDVAVSNGTIGIKPTGSGNNIRYFGGAKMGNVYGGGSGHNNTVRSGRILKNTNVTISGGTIYHNVYGGGAYGTVGDFDYDEQNETVTVDGEQITVKKVSGINGLATSGTGVATVTVTGGTIGYDGKENGMVFGSSRGDINAPDERDDYTAWVYDTHVNIGTAATPATSPEIKGSVYGSGENGHVFNNTVVTVNGGTIGIASGFPITTNDNGTPNDTSDDTILSGAAYPNRGNVYGGGCGTDTYSTTVTEGEGQSAVTKTIQAFNPLAGIVLGNTTVNINGGTVVRNVYGAGAMGSVGKTTWTTETTTVTTGEETETITTKKATTDGGLTTINVSGGTIGVSGTVTVGDGNVFGAARGSKDVVQTDRNDLSRVRETRVTISAGEVKGNVYGGGELGDVGTIIKNTTDYNYTWEKSGGGTNVAENNGITPATNTNTGICNVTITGGTIGSTTAGGNVFGGGKGDANTWWCEKAMAFATNVSISEANGATTVYGSVYGGGEIGRVEDDTKVIIGTLDGSDTPDIKGNVFGAGKGLATRGYSALVRGNSIVTVQGNAQIGGNVFGGGEEASLGRFNLVGGLPKSPQSGGYSSVTIQDDANIGLSGTDNHVYGAGQGVEPNYDAAHYKNFKSMQLEKNKPTGNAGDTWDYYIDDDGKTDYNFVWVYYKTEEDYLAFLNTLALASHPTVTIAENATVYGDVYGGGKRGLTLGNVAVNITGGSVKRDVYGGGSLADTNKGNWDADCYVAATVTSGAPVAGLYTKGTDDKGNIIYTPTAANATAVGGTTYYKKGTWAEGKYNSDTHITAYKTNVNLHSGVIDHNVYGGGLGEKPSSTNTNGTPALVYGDVLVKLNEDTDNDNCVVKGVLHGANNYFGSPKGNVTVHVYKTTTIGEGWREPKLDEHGNPVMDGETPVMVTHKKTDPANLHSDNEALHFYDLKAVYGGGNEAAYEPIERTSVANVIIEGCSLTSIETVYGGGNAASVPGTHVLVNSCYEIGTVFGGGNGLDDLDDHTPNPGANVGYLLFTIPNGATDQEIAAIKTAAEYGSGEALAELRGGTIHKAFGGSNTLGNVRTSAKVDLNEPDPNSCPLCIDEVYGAGNNADQDGKSEIDLGCISYLSEIYGGAKNADVNSDVVLTIQSGRFDRVFGGNNLGGCIRGTITVNIEETGCHPIVIGQLFGGGNQAGYSVKGYRKQGNNWEPKEDGDNIYLDPQLNVKSFTSIGEIYGGGYGETAVIVGNTNVNINECVGVHADDPATDDFTDENGEAVYENNSRVKVSANTGKWIHFVGGKNTDNTDKVITVWQPEHRTGAIGTIGNVFGGGNEAPVHGDTKVQIGQLEYVPVVSFDKNNVRGYYTLSGSTYSIVSGPVSAAAETTYYELVINGDNKNYVEVDNITEGVTDVSNYYIRTGGEGTQDDEYTLVPIPAENGKTYYKPVIGVNITGNVYGGGNAADVTGNTNVIIGKDEPTSTNSSGSGGSGGN